MGKRNIFFIIVFLLFGILLNAQKFDNADVSKAISQCVSDVFKDYNNILLTPEKIINPGQREIEWGRKILEELELQDLNRMEKSRKIQDYISNNYRYLIKSPRSISEINNSGGGNCVSHSIMGIFMLRLAEIPAKIVYEFQLRKPLGADQLRAKLKKTGIFGSGYNTHVWVLFYDGSEWQPFDSALGITGIDEFFLIRTATREGPYLLDPVKRAGPPFLILEDTGKGYIDMENITSDIWDNCTKWNNSKVKQSDWAEFIKPYSELGYRYFEYPLKKEEYIRIKDMSVKWF